MASRADHTSSSSSSPLFSQPPLPPPAVSPSPAAALTPSLALLPSSSLASSAMAPPFLSLHSATIAAADAAISFGKIFLAAPNSPAALAALHVAEAAQASRDALSNSHGEIFFYTTMMDQLERPLLSIKNSLTSCGNQLPENIESLEAEFRRTLSPELLDKAVAECLPASKSPLLIAYLERRVKGIQELWAETDRLLTAMRVRAQNECVLHVMESIVLIQCLPAAQLPEKEAALQAQFAQLPLDLQGKIQGKIWELAGKPAAPDFGKLHTFDDLQRLEQAVLSLEEFPSFSSDQLLNFLQNQILSAIDPTKAEHKETNLKITHKILGFLPGELRGKIEGNLWKLAGCPQGDPQWGRNHILDDAPRLIEAIQMIQRGDQRMVGEEKKSEGKEEKRQGERAVERHASAASARPALHTGNAALDLLLQQQPGKLKEILHQLEVFKRQINYSASEQINNDAVVTILEGHARDPGLSWDICGFLYGQVWEAAGRPQSNDPDFGKHNAFKQLDVLIAFMKKVLQEAGEIEFS